MNDNIKNTEHRGQDPAEGSREIVERELSRHDNGAGQRAAAGKPAQQGDGDGIPHNEAHEIFDRERQRQHERRDVSFHADRSFPNLRTGILYAAGPRV